MQCSAGTRAVKEDEAVAETLIVSFCRVLLQQVLKGDLLPSECWQVGMDKTWSFALPLARQVLPNITRAQRTLCPGWTDPVPVSFSWGSEMLPVL